MLGLSTSTPTIDDTVTLNLNQPWSYGQDVTNVMIHEISEGAMGRTGGLGDPGYQPDFWSTMDLFRYANDGTPDYQDGRDNQPTYFSYDGGNTLSSLSFHNEYMGINQIDTADTFDFDQQDVFGTGSAGETNTLSSTDLQVMYALDWQPTLIEPKSTLPVSVGGTATISHEFLWSYDLDHRSGVYGNP